MKISHHGLLLVVICLAGCKTAGTPSAPTTRESARAADRLFDKPNNPPPIHEVWAGNPSQVLDAVYATAKEWNLPLNRMAEFDSLGAHTDFQSTAGRIKIDAERIDDSHTALDFSGDMKEKFKREFIEKSRAHLKTILSGAETEHP